MGQVVLKDINKFYDSVHAVKDVNLQIRDKEFVVFVGPSGCGKTTTLRMIAGLEAISSGDISIDGQVVNDLAPMDRDIAMVFQNYALYPHMSVYDNMAFGLKMRKFAKAEIGKRVKEAADILGIGELLKRKPRQLSGGQRQRVALGRAIVRHPRVFLFDEPLSNLDAKLRVQMRVELKKLHQRLGTTAIYVTHDQVEAMTLGDRVVVMKDGLVQQVGEPLELYNQPANKFVAGFIGSPAMNFATVTMADGNGRITAKNAGLEIEVPGPHAERLRGHVGQQLTHRHPAGGPARGRRRRSGRADVPLQGRGGGAAGLGDPARRARRRRHHGGRRRSDHARQGQEQLRLAVNPDRAALLRRRDRVGGLRCDGVRLAPGSARPVVLNCRDIGTTARGVGPHGTHQPRDRAAGAGPGDLLRRAAHRPRADPRAGQARTPHTWADYINVGMEHGSFDMAGPGRVHARPGRRRPDPTPATARRR